MFELFSHTLDLIVLEATKHLRLTFKTFRTEGQLQFIDCGQAWVTSYGISISGALAGSSYYALPHFF